MVRLMHKVSWWQKTQVILRWNCISSTMSSESGGAATSGEVLKVSLYRSCGGLTIYDCCWFVLSPQCIICARTIFSVATEQGVIAVDESVLPICWPSVFNFSFDQATAFLKGAKCRHWRLCLCRCREICQTVKWFVMHIIIHTWQCAEWRLWRFTLEAPYWCWQPHLVITMFHTGLWRD